MTEPRRRALKRRLSRASERRFVNPIVRRIVFAGKLGSTYALLGPPVAGPGARAARRSPTASAATRSG
jgi:hypothetical protein